MLDFAVAWMILHPLEGVAALACIAVLVALVLIPGLHELKSHDHPRC